MSFSVSCNSTGLEYSGHDLNGLFAQRRNALSPRFARMLSQIMRFNRRAADDLSGAGWDLTLGDYLKARGFGGLFRTHYLLPMGAAIWSSPLDTVERMPARLFVEFFRNHGLLTVNDQPQWRTLVGGSCQYVNALLANFRGEVRLDCPVRHVSRSTEGIYVNANSGSERFDQVIFACHSDQALRILVDPSPQEREILGALPFERNEVTLHTDSSLLPRSRRAWAAWNYSLDEHDGERARVTYNMNLLQGIQCDSTICVTLNDSSRIRDDCVLGQFVYEHPVYTAESQAARHRHWQISGVNRTWYCGAYWGHGFHEDGFQSAADVVSRLDSEERVAA